MRQTSELQKIKLSLLYLKFLAQDIIALRQIIRKLLRFLQTFVLPCSGHSILRLTSLQHQSISIHQTYIVVFDNIKLSN